MRILHTADWHLGRRIEGRSRHDEQAAALDEICRIAEEERADAVLIAGDVFDTYQPPTESENLFYTTLTRLADGGRRAVIVIAGNHDSPDRLLVSDPYARALGITTVGYPKDIPSLHDGGSDRVSRVESDTSFVRLRLPRNGEFLNLLALPYPSESRLREALAGGVDDEEAALRDYNRRVRDFMAGIARRFVPGGANIVASHLFVDGGLESDSERPISVGGAYAVDAMSFPATAGYVALGHLHRPQEKRGEEEIPIRYAGSILQYSFSETGQEKSVTMVEFDGGTMTHRTIPLGSGRRLVRVRAASVEELERTLAAADLSAWLDVAVRVEEPLPVEYVTRLRSKHTGIVFCRADYVGNNDEHEQIRVSDLRLDEQFRRFVREKFGLPPNEEVVRLFMELASEEEEPDDSEPSRQ